MHDLHVRSCLAHFPCPPTQKIIVLPKLSTIMRSVSYICQECKLRKNRLTYKYSSLILRKDLFLFDKKYHTFLLITLSFADLKKKKKNHLKAYEPSLFPYQSSFTTDLHCSFSSHIDFNLNFFPSFLISISDQIQLQVDC